MGIQNSLPEKISGVFSPPSPPTYGSDFKNLMRIPRDPAQESKGNIPIAFYRPRLTILYAGGHDEDIGSQRDWFGILTQALKSNLVTFEYPGYGLSTNPLHGSKEDNPELQGCSEQTLADDILTVFRHLVVNEGIPASEIVLWGKTLGCYPVIDLASHLLQHHQPSKPHRLSRTISITNKGMGFLGLKHGESSSKHSTNCTTIAQPLALILQTPFLSAHKLNDKWPNVFDNEKKAEKLKYPILIIHPSKDPIIPFLHSKKLSSKLPRAPWKLYEISEGTFSNLESHFADDILEILLQFFEFLAPESAHIQRQAPDAIANSPLKVISAWLERIELSQYVQNFLVSGYFDLESISTICDESELEMIGIAEEFRPRLLLAISRLQKGNSEDDSSSSPRARMRSLTRRRSFSESSFLAQNEHSNQTQETPSKPFNSFLDSSNQEIKTPISQAKPFTQAHSSEKDKSSQKHGLLHSLQSIGGFGKHKNRERGATLTGAVMTFFSGNEANHSNPSVSVKDSIPDRRSPSPPPENNNTRPKSPRKNPLLSLMPKKTKKDINTVSPTKSTEVVSDPVVSPSQILIPISNKPVFEDSDETFTPPQTPPNEPNEMVGELKYPLPITQIEQKNPNHEDDNQSQGSDELSKEIYSTFIK